MQITLLEQTKKKEAKTMTQNILCPKCYKNLFYAQSNETEELLLKCKNCGKTWNLHLKPTEPPLITYNPYLKKSIQQTKKKRGEKKDERRYKITKEKGRYDDGLQKASKRVCGPRSG
jgi:transcription elongation factor Elf1